MSKHIVLVFNMGHSGGRWLQDVCNIHEDVQLWQEANHFLGISHLETEIQLNMVYDFFMKEYQENTHKTIGLIKAFDHRLIKFCEEKDGSIIQMLRHPIGVVNAKIGKKMEECRYRGRFIHLNTDKEIFEAHVDLYAHFYKTYLLNNDKWPVIRLEDLNESLATDYAYFKNITEDFLQIEWSENHIKTIQSLYSVRGDLSRAYSKHISDKDILAGWEKWKQEIFLKYFEHIMESLEYTW